MLLKNRDNVLPLNANAKVAVIGLADANSTIYGGTGSGSVIPSYGLTPLDAISAFANVHGGSVSFTPIVNSSDWMSAAIAAAEDADVAIVFVGTTSGEGKDRPSLGLGSVQACVTCQQDLLVAAVAKAQPKTIVSVVSPGAVLLPFVDDVAAILASFMPGQSYGGAIRDVLYGVVNPSGKLPVTFPNHDNETQFSTAQWPGLPGPPPPPGAGGQQQITEANYTERLLVGYRYYDAKGIKLTTGFPFGFGAHCTSIIMARHSRTFLEKSSTHGCNLVSELAPSFDSFECLPCRAAPCCFCQACRTPRSSIQISRPHQHRSPQPCKTQEI